MKLGFIGTGVITEAIIVGLQKAEFPVDEIVISARTRETSARLAARFGNIRVCENNAEIAETADILFLAVLPQHAEDVISSLEFRAGQQIVSVIATIPIEKLQGWTHPDANICRAIPLPSVADLSCATVVFPPTPIVEALFDALGTAIPAHTIDEFDSFVVASAMMGYYYGVSEAAAQWLGGQGVEYDNARAYLATSFQNLANTATNSPKESFAELRERHSTPGGLNAQFFEQFVVEGGEQALDKAFESVSARARSNR
ncbi:MAG: pyrroline-5-carboxylate reductase [Paracoccaceae bacterium]|jgi:pyrroline-5-carboxylate reductase|nr:pyrroline-5-carboxylate reductase [Paracoccaceae bacterium]